MKKYFILCLLLVSFTAFVGAQQCRVIDTDFSKGQLKHKQTLEYEDLVKFHGHSCDGLLEGMLALQLGLKELYPNGIIDRTNTRVVSKSSPCLTDAAIYLTGGRYQYNSFYVDNAFEGLYILQRKDTKKTVRLIRKAGVKPSLIDSLGALAIQQKLSYVELQKLRKLEEAYADKLRASVPATLFTVKIINDFNWQSNLKKTFVKTDIINKNKRK